MLLLRALLLLGLCIAVPAKAGLFADDKAREQIKQLEARMQSLEDDARQHVKSMLDLQSQIEELSSDIRKLRGKNEELAHGLQDAEKRQKDFYVDLDTRVRNLESAEVAIKETVPASAVSSAPTILADPSDPGPENRAFEAAYGLYKSGSHADAIKAFHEHLNKYPDSVHIPNAKYWLGKSQFAIKDYKNALTTYQLLLRDFPRAPKAPDALYGIAGCQRGLKQHISARKTLNQLIAKYPDSEAAAKARKLLAPPK